MGSAHDNAECGVAGSDRRGPGDDRTGGRVRPRSPECLSRADSGLETGHVLHLRVRERGGGRVPVCLSQSPAVRERREGHRTPRRGCGPWLAGEQDLERSRLPAGLWHRLLGRPASESGRLCHGDGGCEGVTARRRALMLPTLLVGSVSTYIVVFWAAMRRLSSLTML